MRKSEIKLRIKIPMGTDLNGPIDLDLCFLEQGEACMSVGEWIEHTQSVIVSMREEIGILKLISEVQ